MRPFLSHCLECTDAYFPHFFKLVIQMEIKRSDLNIKAENSTQSKQAGVVTNFNASAGLITSVPNTLVSILSSFPFRSISFFLFLVSTDTPAVVKMGNASRSCSYVGCTMADLFHLSCRLSAWWRLQSSTLLSMLNIYCRDKTLTEFNTY